MNAPMIPIWLAEMFPPSRDLLLRLLVTSMPEALFQEIARCDYGMGYDENLNALNTITRTGSIPIPLEWNPREVCCLTRWSEEQGERTSHKAALAAFHKKRAFACCVLTIAGVDQLYDSEKDTLVQVVESIVALDQPELSEAAVSMLMWRLTPGDHLGTDRPFVVFAIILLVLLNRSLQISSVQLSDIVAWLTDEEAYAYLLHEKESGWVPQRSIWMTVLFASHDQRNQKWGSLAQRLFSSYPVFEPWLSRMTHW